jgi:hypothetical protein
MIGPSYDMQEGFPGKIPWIDLRGTSREAKPIIIL